ncbi:hypothetical protein KIW84_010721 [Lathyrus oleraceus]|uniref:Envelope-like protein n=1 Tax=Pisum sativum TaxID=3888 RepID=A0A9D4YKM4_PEA|nr:hypothetical protein KIW84_010721 [Pisum sativum]
MEDESSDDEDDILVQHLKPSVTKRMKTRKGRSVAEMMTTKTAKKGTTVGPSKSWSKVEVKKRKVRESSDLEEDVEDDVPDISPIKSSTTRKSPTKVAAVHLDNISFHFEDGATKWKICNPKESGCGKRTGQGCCGGGKCVKFSPTVINKFLGRGTEGAGELEATDNEVYREITVGQVKEWPSKKHLSAGKLTVKYAILHKIGSANWVPTNHISTNSNALGRLIFSIGTKLNFDYGSHVNDIVMTSAVKKPASQGSLIVELKETCKELETGIRVAKAMKEDLEVLINSLEQGDRDNIGQAKETKAHTSSERSESQDKSSGSSGSEADEDASSSD